MVRKIRKTVRTDVHGWHSRWARVTPKKRRTGIDGSGVRSRRTSSKVVYRRGKARTAFSTVYFPRFWLRYVWRQMWGDPRKR